MKRKALVTSAIVALLAAVVIGGTMAYFTDKDAQTNTFTVGNVKIDLFEDFGDNSGIENLIPATGSAQDGTLQNGIEKEAYVKNTGAEKAYVRVHIAIPAILDDGAPTYNAAANTLHFNSRHDTMGGGLWNWGKQAGAPEGEYFKGGDTWNCYQVSINNVDYNVYVVTYETALEKDQTTCDAMHQVYLDSKTTQEQIESIKTVLGDKWHIYVVAQGVQAAGFSDAYDALNTAFPTNPTAEDFLNAGKDQHFVEVS